MPTFARVKPVPSLVLRAKARDGFEVESYLTLPATGGHRHPLVVMPHGGPQGVRDTRSFDPEVQLLAHYGYAVLRVNFRGSSGFGKAFREGGLHNWGRGIEDDILAALDGALAAQPLDTARVALRGTSYGGYSALMGLVRSPDRFRCGVAIAAVTDLPLLFVAGDGGQRVDDRKALGTLLGDPLRKLAELEDMSPAYRTRDLRQPILIVHERGDARVPIEHAMRLGLMLAADGRAPSFLPVDEVSHGHFSARGRLVVEAAGFALLNRCLVKR
jgi:dipeptidyl aminopeptidase/acylaminoacyl peptidase